jgi:hypothetical protein
VEDAYIGAQVGAGLITLHAIGADVVGGRWAVALCFSAATEVTSPFWPGLDVIIGDGSRVRDRRDGSGVVNVVVICPAGGPSSPLTVGRVVRPH